MDILKEIENGTIIPEATQSLTNDAEDFLNSTEFDVNQFIKNLDLNVVSNGDYSSFLASLPPSMTEFIEKMAKNINEYFTLNRVSINAESTESSPDSSSNSSLDISNIQKDLNRQFLEGEIGEEEITNFLTGGLEKGIETLKIIKQNIEIKEKEENTRKEL